MNVAEAAQVLGVKERELSSVRNGADGAVVTDKNGHKLLINDEGVFWYDYVPNVPAKEGGPPNAALPVWVSGDGPAEEPEPEPKKTAAAGAKK